VTFRAKPIYTYLNFVEISRLPQLTTVMAQDPDERSPLLRNSDANGLEDGSQEVPY